MSEPNAGTDVLGMRTRAVPTSVSGVDGYVINGTKMWITNGTISGDGTGDVYLVYARTGDGRSDITQFVVEGGMPGFRLGSKIGDKLGMRASPTAELVFEDVFVPSRTHVVGDANGAASCMMRNLEIERVALAAMAVGIARRALDEMASFASSRSAFGRPNLFGFGQIQRHVSESYAEYRAGKSYLYAVANGLDLHGGGGERVGCRRGQALLRDHGEKRFGPGDTGSGWERIRGRVRRRENVERFETVGDRRRDERESSQEHVEGFATDGGEQTRMRMK